MLWQNSITEILTKLKNSNCDENFDKNQKLKLWQKSKTQIVTKLKNLNFYNSKTQIVTKLKKLNCDKTKKLKSWQN